MSRRSVQRKKPTTNAIRASQLATAVSQAVDELLATVESKCNRAAAIATVTARALTGAELGLQHDDVPSVYAAALANVAGELEGLSDRALKARTAGGAA